MRRLVLRHVSGLNRLFVHQRTVPTILVMVESNLGMVSSPFVRVTVSSLGLKHRNVNVTALPPAAGGLTHPARAGSSLQRGVPP